MRLGKNENKNWQKFFFSNHRGSIFSRLSQWKVIFLIHTLMIQILQKKKIEFHLMVRYQVGVW